MRENTLDTDIENPEMWLVCNYGLYITRREDIELSFLKSTSLNETSDKDILCEVDEDELFLELAGLTDDNLQLGETGEEVVQRVIKKYRG